MPSNSHSPMSSCRFLNGAKAGGGWITVRQALVRWASLVLPSLLRIPHWLQQHAAELDDWLVDASGTLLTREEWESHPCAEAVCAAEYSQLYAAFLAAHGPPPQCPCERCRGTIQGQCEQLRARWAHRFTIRLAEAGAQLGFWDACLGDQCGILWQFVARKVQATAHAVNANRTGAMGPQSMMLTSCCYC